MASFGFCGGTYQHRSSNVNAEKCINLYPEIGPGKSGKVSLIGTPGRSVLATLPASPVRGVWAGDNIVYAVAGGNFYDVTIGGFATFRGALNAATTPAKIVTNGNQLLICSGDEVFCDSGAGPVSVLTDGYVSITFLDGYFVALRNPTGTNGLTRDRIYISALFDGTSWDPLDFGERQGSSDRLVAIEAHNQQLWLWGQETSEAWYNSGNSDFPFERIQGSQIQMGIWPWTLAPLDHSLFYGGSDPRGGGVIYRTEGFRPRRVSNHAVENSLLSIGPTSYPKGWTYEEGGHMFYVLCLPLETWVYDVATDMWHQRAKWDGSAWDPDDGVCAAHLYGNGIVVGSATTGKLYLQSLDIYADQGSAIRRYRQAPYIADEANRVFFRKLQLDIETGTQFSGTPTALMRYSSDGGHTFTADKSVNLGANGQYGKRAIWRRLGSGRGRVFGITLPDIVNGPVAIVDAYVDAVGGQ